MTIGTKHQEHFETVLTTVAHEMVHLSLYIDGCPSFNQHRKAFRMKTAQIGDLYGFDRKMLQSSFVGLICCNAPIARKFGMFSKPFITSGAYFLAFPAP